MAKVERIPSCPGYQRADVIERAQRLGKDPKRLWAGMQADWRTKDRDIKGINSEPSIPTFSLDVVPRSEEELIRMLREIEEDS